MNDFRLRQIHLDFHTSPAIDGIGAKFDKKEWQEMLKLGHVDSITVFSKCHHGYSYHPSEVNEMHPGLDFDLLGAQLEACREIGVKAPVYISAGFDEKDANEHPEWLYRGYDDNAGSFMNPGYHLMCLNTGYLDKLLAEIEEVMQRYNPCEIFLDILGERNCRCSKCRADMTRLGYDFTKDEDVIEFGKISYRYYLDKVEETIRKYNPDTVIFHNSGHVTKGRRDLISSMSHLELESLPTGGWGYDHFPLSAAYARTLRENFLGMTGKFHKTWGEFGGFKHPNALKYETALSLAMGAGCSIGDQMHPNGQLNRSTLALIGEAYKEVEAKEPLCIGAKYLPDIGILCAEAMQGGLGDAARQADIGANRVLLETKRLYNAIDIDEDFSKYKLLILPDIIRIDGVLKTKIDEYLANGGRLLLSGVSGLDESNAFAVDAGIEYIGKNEFSPSYEIPEFETVNGKTAYLMRADSHKIKNIDATVIAMGQDPYFNRTAQHFCSHQHAPNNEAYDYPAAVIKGNIAYIGWDAFRGYARFGDFHIKELINYAIKFLMKDDFTVSTSLPDRGIVSLLEQGNRKIVHLLFAHTTNRGADTEVIEDIVPLYNIEVSVKCGKPSRVILVPQNEEIDFSYENGKASFTVPKVDCHQMISIE